MENKKEFSPLIGIVVVIVAVVIVGGISAYQYFTTPKPVACTMEAKLCPGGSAVGRTGPKCEFTECPVIQDQNNDLNVGDQQVIDGLKTYADVKLNVSFKYPADWKIESTVKSSTSNDGYVLTPSDFNTYYKIYISPLDCKSIIKQYPEKMTACKEAGNIAVYYYGGPDNIEMENTFDAIVTSITKINN